MKCPICGGPLVSRTEEVTYRGIRIGEFPGVALFRLRRDNPRPSRVECGQAVRRIPCRTPNANGRGGFASRRSTGQLGGVSSTEFRLLWACRRESPDRDWGSFSPGHRATYAVGGNSPSLILM